jgi:glycosyltransferase involved in cell wall biosynthesis
LLSFLRWKDSGNTEVIYNGVDGDRFSFSTRRDIGECFNIGMVGSLTDKKDQETIIKSLLLLNGNVHLHLAGEGPRRQFLESLVEELGLVSKVTFCGLVQNISEFLECMDLCVQSSKFEGFGLAAVEAMCSKKAVLCSDIPGLRELSNSRLHLFKQGSNTSLANKINLFMIDEKFREELLDVSDKTAMKFSIKNMNAKFTVLYGLIHGY